MRLATVLRSARFLGACTSTAPQSTPADWAALADALGSEAYADTSVDELATWLAAAGGDLTRDHRQAIYIARYQGTERDLTLIEHNPNAGPELRPESILSPAQILGPRALQVKARAALVREAARR